MPINTTPHQPPLRFEPLDLVGFSGASYVYVRRCEAGHVIRRHGGEIEETFTQSDMAGFVLRHDFVHIRGYYAEHGAFARERSGVSSLADLRPAERSKVAWKTWWVEQFLKKEAAEEATRSDESMQVAIDASKAQALGLDCARLDTDELKAKERRAKQKAKKEGKDQENGSIVAKPKTRKKRAGQIQLVREAPCPRTLRSWIQIYEKGGCCSHALRERYRKCGNRAPRLCGEVYEIIKQAAKTYSTEKRPTIVKICKDVAADIEAANILRENAELPLLAMPSKKVVRKAVKALPVFGVYAGRHGVEAARKRFQIVKDCVDVTRPGERLEMDEWTAHLHKILEEANIWAQLPQAERRQKSTRLLANIILDCASRCVVGLAIGPTATGELAKAAMRMVVIDKNAIAASAGCTTPWDMALNPELVVTDGGSGLVSEESTNAIRDLGARHDVPPGGMPQRRPFIERFNRTIDLSLLPHFTGRSFTNVEDRGDYDAQLRASLTVETFTLAFIRWIVDVYHNTPHEGLGGETPREAWLRLSNLHGVIPPPGVDRRRAIFGTELIRQVTLRGIRFLGLHYHDHALAERILERGPFEATIRVDEDDVSAISLRVGDAWRRIPCRTEGLEGISIKVWTAAAADMRRRYARKAEITQPVVLEALAAIKRMAAESERAVGILRLAPMAESIHRIETELLAGFEVPNVDTNRPPAADPLQRAIPTGTLEPPAEGGSETPPAEPRRNFEIEE